VSLELHPELYDDPRQEPLKHQQWPSREGRKFYFRRAEIFQPPHIDEYWLWVLTPEMAEAIAMFWDQTDRWIFERTEDFYQYLAKKYPEYMIKGYNDNPLGERPKWKRQVYDELFFADRPYFVKQDFYVHDRYPRWPLWWFWLFWPLKDDVPQWIYDRYRRLRDAIRPPAPPEMLALPKPELKYRMFVQRYTKTKFK
jgi:hypothetical protein